MDFSRVWKSIAAGLCGSAAHTGLMALKSWARILPGFEPYSDLQALLASLTFFPVIGKGPFAMDAGLGLKPTIFSLLMVLTYSVTLSTVYSIFGLPRRASTS